MNIQLLAQQFKSSDGCLPAALAVTGAEDDSQQDISYVRGPAGPRTSNSISCRQQGVCALESVVNHWLSESCMQMMAGTLQSKGV